jgi:CSLREA domain-containing protein
MPLYPHHSFIRKVRFISICLSLVAVVSLFSRWPGSLGAARNVTRSNPTSLAATQVWRGNGVVSMPAGNTITVNSTFDLANGADSLCTLREAITAANSNTASGATGGECVAGSSTGSDTIDLTGLTGVITLTSVLPNISSNATINGPGSGVLTIQRGGPMPFTVFTISSSAIATISGLTIQGGAPNSSNEAINNSGTLSLTDCVVSGFGSGLANTGQFTLTISNSVISGNLNGGGISNIFGTINLVNSVVSGNSSGAFGPGIANSFGTLNVIDSTITGNSGGDRAVNNGIGGTATILNSTISNNSNGGILNNGNLSMIGGSITGNANGGGIVAGGNSVIEGVTISNNSNNSTNFFGGGGVFITGSGPSSATTIINCLITSNSTNGNGGGIRNGGVKATLINTTISGNTSNGGGGGLDVVDGGLGNTIAINVTISGNRSNSGGGVFRESGPVKFKNSVIARNFRLDGTTPDDINGTIDASSSHNLIGPGGSGGLTDGVNNNQVGVADPRLGPLANNGGPTFTHSLLSNSPALDAGDNCVTEASHCGIANIPQVTTDQRGFNRIVDGPDADTSATVDIGAYETQLVLAALPDTSTNEDTQLVVPFEASDTSTITSVTASSDNVTLVSNDSAHLTAVLKGTTGIVTINPVANLFGTTNITVTVNRTGGGSDIKTFMLTVHSSNDAPTFTKGADQLVNEDASAQTVTNWATGMSPGPADESGQTLTFQVTNNTNASLFSSGPAIDSTGTLTYTPAANANGSATITVVLKDSGGTANGGVDTSAPQTFNININAVNDAPSFTKGTDRTVNEDSGLQFVGWATNISAGAANESTQILTFQITSNTNPGLFSIGPGISSQGTLGFAPASNAHGSATITVLLKDNGGTANGGFDTSQEETFTITVNSVNDRPSFTRGPNQTVLINAGAQSVANWATNISAGPANESGQTLNFQVTSNTNPSLFTVVPSISPTGTLTYQPAANTEGTAIITINLKDDGGTANGGQDTSISQSFIITVTAVALQFSSSSIATAEGAGSTTVTVVRTGDLSRVVGVDYATSGDPGLACSAPFGVASPKCDFTSALGTLTFAAGEEMKTITILISEDSFVEGPETLSIFLSKPTGGSALANPSIATVTIDDDAIEPATNPIDDAGNFVRQHYHDFLNREPDAAGLAFWTNEITSCGADPQCIEIKRINVSAAFFLSIEFQETGYLVYRMYKTAYGDTTSPNVAIPVPIIRLNEFLPDAQRISQGVRVGIGDWQAQLEANKNAFAHEFVVRQRFLTAFPLTMTAEQFVDKLNLMAGDVLSPTERSQLIAELNAASDVTQGRASVLRKVADDDDLRQRETTRAFVLMQYCGYMRRNPDDPQDTDFRGWAFWLNKLNEFNGNFIQAEMVKAFISSIEYRQRFGQ